MVQANFGKAGYVYNGIDASEYGSSMGDDGPMTMGKQKRGGVGGRGSKSNNHFEAKKANIRRNEKRAREEAKEKEQAQAAWMREETKKWQPVDKKDQRHQQRMQAKSNKKVAKAAKAAQKAADNE